MAGVFTERFDKHFIKIFAAGLFALVILAWSNRFIQDDAFISFRYADNLAHGKGLTWNPGERIEGYTNFLWTLIISGCIYMGGNPSDCAEIIGLLFFFLSLIFTYRLSLLLFQSKAVSLAVLLLLGTNYTFSSWATGGLETQMQTALFVMAAYYCVEGMLSNSWSLRKVLALSIILTAAQLTRLDSAIICLVIFAAIFFSLRKDVDSGLQHLKKLAVFIAPPLIILGGWFLWKLFYYGHVLPNTFYIKASSLTSFSRGINYLYIFSISYFILPFLLIGLFAVKSLFRKSNLPLIVLLSILGIWILYIVKIGGDFMEFRFLVPVMPFMFILIAWLIFRFINLKYFRLALITIILAGTIHHQATFTYNPTDGIEPVRDLYSHLFGRTQNWVQIGKTLASVFRDSRDVKIATTAAGAIPYYSGLYTVDMLGINDPWVAQHGFFIGTVPGHQRISPFSYLIERRVNLIISHPLVLGINSPVQQFPLLPLSKGEDISSAKVLEIPIDPDYKVIALYLTPSVEIDRAIERFSWKVHQIAMR